MDNRITLKQDLLNDQGHIINPGYATEMLYDYNREKVRSNALRIKEWDFYQIMMGEWVLKMTIGNIGYVAEFSADLFNVKTKELLSFSKLKLLPLNKIKMPLHPDDHSAITINEKGFNMSFKVNDHLRQLRLSTQDKKLGRIEVDVDIHIDKEHDKLVIATPFNKPHQFYLNCKENYFKVSGIIQFGNRIVKLDETASAVLDWGRGVWPFEEEWYWGNGSTYIDGNQFAFNIGWGFGDLKHASENIMYLNGKAMKLGRIDYDIDTKDYMKPWSFKEENGRFEMVMTPLYDKIADTRLGLIQMYCHQLFGYYNGYVILDDGSKLEIKNMLAFCEHAHNRW